MSNPLVTVVIPLFNKEDFVLEALQSLHNQTYSNWECIIIDDGSTDTSITKVKSYISKVPGVWKILSQENMGPSAARNTGIKSALGKYIALLDADDLWFKDKLMIQVQYLEKNPNVSLLLSNYIIFNQLNISSLRGIRAKRIDQQTRRWLDMRGFGGLVESTGMMRTSSVRDELLFDSELMTAEGLDLVIKWNLETEVFIIRKFLTMYRISENQLHKNTALISRNVKELSRRYSSKLKFADKSLRSQNAYFILANMRDQRKSKILSQMLRNLVTLNFDVFLMAVWIICRNLRSKILGPATKRESRDLILDTNSQLARLSP